MTWLQISFVIYAVVLVVALGIFFLDVRIKDRRRQARESRSEDLDSGGQLDGS